MREKRKLSGAIRSSRNNSRRFVAELGGLLYKSTYCVGATTQIVPHARGNAVGDTSIVNGGQKGKKLLERTWDALRDAGVDWEESSSTWEKSLTGTVASKPGIGSDNWFLAKKKALGDAG